MDYKDKQVWKLIKAKTSEVRHIERYAYFKNYGIPSNSPTGKALDYISLSGVYSLRHNKTLAMGKIELKTIVDKLVASGRLIEIPNGYIRPSVSLILLLRKEKNERK
jgi:hypothetical protein